MLRVNVGLSRKLSKDYNSAGYSINLDGEITAPISDAEAVVEQVKELFDLAEEALDQQIERERSTSRLAARDHAESPADGNRIRNRLSTPSTSGNWASGDELATNKQVQYLLSIAKRQRLSTLQLEEKIAEILGYQVGLYDLTKKAAASVLDALTGTGRSEKATAQN